MSVVAITGAQGVVGRALMQGLGDIHEIIPIDLPEVDASDPVQTRRAFMGADTVIHLAGVFDKENWRSTNQDPKNTALFNSVLYSALAARVGRFIHASSIHAEDSLGFMKAGSGLLVAEPRRFTTTVPSGYGQAKRDQERSLEQNAVNFRTGAISIRLGAVTPDGIPLRTHRDPEVLNHEQQVWLSHGDLSDLIQLIINKEQSGYHVLYAVSNNPGRFHDTTNNFGWEPQADSASWQ